MERLGRSVRFRAFQQPGRRQRRRRLQAAGVGPHWLQKAGEAREADRGCPPLEAAGAGPQRLPLPQRGQGQWRRARRVALPPHGRAVPEQGGGCGCRLLHPCGTLPGVGHGTWQQGHQAVMGRS